MFRRTAPAIAFSAALVAASPASAVEFSKEYLAGLWSLDGAEACGTDAYEYVSIRADGIVETGNDGAPTGTGFWEIDDEKNEMIWHLSTSPAFHHDELQNLSGSFDNFTIRVVTFNLEDNQLEAIGLLGTQVARGTFTRCP